MVDSAYFLRAFTITMLGHTDQNKREKWRVETTAPARNLVTDLKMFVGLTPTLFLVYYLKNVNDLGSISSMILDTAVKL